MWQEEKGCLKCTLQGNDSKHHTVDSIFVLWLHKGNSISQIAKSDWSLSLLLPHLLALPNIRHCAKCFIYIIAFTSHTKTYETGTINILTSCREH